MKKRNNIQTTNNHNCHQKQTDKKYKQTINQLSPSGESCSANSGVGLSFIKKQAGNSLLPNECPGAATITNYFLPISSPRDALGILNQKKSTYSGPIDKYTFTKIFCSSFTIWQKIKLSNNLEGPPMG